MSYLNPQFVSLFGYAAKDLPNLDDWWEKSCPSRSERKRLLAQIIGAEGKVVQTRVRCKNGDFKDVETQKVDLPSGEGILSCVDVSEQVTHQVELQQRKQELKKHAGRRDAVMLQVFKNNAENGKGDEAV